MMTFGSLFAGIGGLDLGLERVGMKCKWQVEINPYAKAVLEKHWPTVHRHDDVRTAGAGNLASVDLICGGFPCTDISVAGKRAGIDGEKSGLWRDYARIVGEIRPHFVLVENVAALLGLGLDRVLGDLAALGYDAEWDCIPAAALGAPHRRDRIFIVAHAHGWSPQFQQERQRGSEREAHARCHGGTSQLADAKIQGLEGCGIRGSVGQRGAKAAVPNSHSQRRKGNNQLNIAESQQSASPGSDADGHSETVRRVFEPGCLDRYLATQPNAWPAEPRVGGEADGVSVGLDGPWRLEAWEGDSPRTKEKVKRRADRLTCLGNAVVPQVAQFIGQRILEAFPCTG